MRPPRKPHEWYPDFLKHLAANGNVSAAARAANISLSSVYNARQKDEDFAAEVEWALAEAYDSLENEAWRRGRDGVSEPVIWQGEIQYHRDPDTGLVVLNSDGRPIPITIQKYSDAILLALLKAHKPEKFSDRTKIEHTGNAGGPIKIEADSAILAAEKAYITAMGLNKGSQSDQ